MHFIRHAREFGFSVDPIRELIALASNGDRSCADIDAIARYHWRYISAHSKTAPGRFLSVSNFFISFASLLTVPQRIFPSNRWLIY
nr:MerR family DNA-binding protein [Halomonas flagellata]